MRVRHNILKPYLKKKRTKANSRSFLLCVSFVFGGKKIKGETIQIHTWMSIHSIRHDSQWRSRHNQWLFKILIHYWCIHTCILFFILHLNKNAIEKRNKIHTTLFNYVILFVPVLVCLVRFSLIKSIIICGLCWWLPFQTHVQFSIQLNAFSSPRNWLFVILSLYVVINEIAKGPILEYSTCTHTGYCNRQSL